MDAEADVELEGDCVSDCDRTCNFRGFGRSGMSLCGLDDGLDGVPIAASADANFIDVSLDHFSYRAWTEVSGIVLIDGLDEVSVPDWLLCWLFFAFVKKFSAKASSASSLISSVLPAHVPSLRMAMN